MNEKELKQFGRSAGFDIAAIGCMAMWALGYGGIWNELGPVGYFVEWFLVGAGVLVLPLMMLVAWMIRQKATAGLELTEADEKALAGILKAMDVSPTYMSALVVRELLFCLAFAVLGFGGLMFCNLLTTALIYQLWAGKAALPQAA